MIGKVELHLDSGFLGKEDLTCLLADMTRILMSEDYLAQGLLFLILTSEDVLNDYVKV